MTKSKTEKRCKHRWSPLNTINAPRYCFKCSELKPVKISEYNDVLSTKESKGWEEKIRNLWMLGDEIEIQRKQGRKIMWETVLDRAVKIFESELEKIRAEAKQEVYLEMIVSDLPTDYTGTATNHQEYSENMKKFILNEIGKHKIAIKRLQAIELLKTNK